MRNEQTYTNRELYNLTTNMNAIGLSELQTDSLMIEGWYKKNNKLYLDTDKGIIVTTSPAALDTFLNIIDIFEEDYIDTDMPIKVVKKRSQQNREYKIFIYE